YIECITNNGVCARVQIKAQHRSSSILSLISHYSKTPPEYTIILALGASKQIRRSFILEKSVELCIRELWIWQGEHSQVDSTIHSSWYEVLYNAATQCGNPYIPTLRSFSSIKTMVAYAQEQNSKQLFFYEDPDISVPTKRSQWEAHKQPLVLIVGCEGGFSHNEFSFLQEQNITPHSLGSTCLRFETASLVACSLAVMLNDSKGISM
ncbi:MAG: RNA methyltransferase, partial [Desulfovibrionaceae bacterium]|nr:RNA methyltransferase [Desulfovibrionaceae bacterium]